MAMYQQRQPPDRRPPLTSPFESAILPADSQGRLEARLSTGGCAKSVADGSAFNRGPGLGDCTNAIRRLMGMLALSLAFTLAFLAWGCSKGATQTPAGTPQASRTPQATTSTSRPVSPSAAAKAAQIVKLKTVRYVDTQGIGTEAFSMLVPSDWQFEGGITWVLDNPAMPATARFRAWDPASAAQFEALPSQAFFWSDSPLSRSLFPIGSRYFGAEVRPPLAPGQALTDIVLARFRGSGEELRTITQADVADVGGASSATTQLAGGVSTSTKGAMVRVEYRQGGVYMEEELYCAVESLLIPMTTVSGTVTSTFWNVSYISGFRVERGRLDSNARMFQAMARSFTPNPQWFNKYNQVVQYLIQAQIQRIQSLGELSRIISQTSNDISDMMMDSYNQRQAVNDRIADSFSQYVRGVDEYYDPIAQKTIELPAGYQNAWANSLGEYILSDSPSFDPNVGSNLDWQRLGR